MRGEVYHLVREDLTRHVRPYDVVQVRVVTGPATRKHYRIVETPVRRTFTRRGAHRVVRRLNSREAS